MRFSPTTLSLLIAPLFLGGCCAFVPCHPATCIAGTVTDALSDQPISNAVVRLYFYKARTADSGCFSLGGADALPFEFGVSAPGYQSVIKKAVRGTYWATVRLVPEGGAGNSNATLRDIPQAKYVTLSADCH